MSDSFISSYMRCKPLACNGVLTANLPTIGWDVTFLLSLNNKRGCTATWKRRSTDFNQVNKNFSTYRLSLRTLLSSGQVIILVNLLILQEMPEIKGKRR